MNLFAKGHKNNPRNAEELAAYEQRDTRTYFEKVADAKAKYGISDMSDEELDTLWAQMPTSDERKHAVRSERNQRRAARTTAKEQYVQAAKDYNDYE
jgi:hypothetical protein